MPLQGDSFVIGRSSLADLSIPDRFMSRQHTRLIFRNGGYLVEDLGSHNGTLLNGKPVVEPTPVRSGDVLTISNTVVTLRSGDALTPPKPGPISAHKIKKDATLLIPSELDPRQAETRDELRRFAERLKLVNEVNAALAQSLTQDALLELILDRIFDHLEPEQGQILMRGEDGEYRPAAQRSVDIGGGGFLVSRSLIREVAEERAAILSVDAAADARFAAAQSILISGIKSILAVPLFVGDNTLGLIALTSRLQNREFNEGDLELLGSLASVAAMRLHNLDLLVRDAERRRLQEELRLARQIQKGLLPRQLPELKGYDVLARNIPWDDVSGDYYGVYEREGEFVFMLADVSGKGISAAMLAASLEALAAGPIEVGRSPEEICTRCSRRLYERTPAAKYATSFIVVLDPETGHCRYTNAGHNAAIVARAAGGTETLESSGFPIGLVPGATYEAQELTLEPGDVLVLYTDGLTEAANADEEEYGIERLAAVCDEYSSEGLEALLKAMASSLDEFVDGHPYSDDRTVLMVRRQE